MAIWGGAIAMLDFFGSWDNRLPHHVYQLRFKTGVGWSLHHKKSQSERAMMCVYYKSITAACNRTTATSTKGSLLKHRTHSSAVVLVVNLHSPPLLPFVSNYSLLNWEASRLCGQPYSVYITL